MRHFFAACPVATLSRGMAASTRLTALVALSRTLKRAVSGPLGAVLGAINLATVAATADHDLHPAADAEEQSC
jgi:hypothetical protein